MPFQCHLHFALHPCSEAEGESDEDMSSEDESLASEGEEESEYDAESDEEEGACGGRRAGWHCGDS